jgi:hypothetical protein
MGQRSSLQNRVADIYFCPKLFEQSGRLFGLLGIPVFKKWMVKWGYFIGKDSTFEQEYFLWDRSLAGLRSFEGKTRRNETIHLAIAVIALPGVLGAFVRGWVALGIVLLILVVATQFYPVMLQRYHRVRLYRVMGQMERREIATNQRGGLTVD